MTYQNWVQTATGQAFDLVYPKPEMVDFEVDIAESLSRQARFNGHVRSGPYSVAQHCVMGADALMRETGEAPLAAAFLLHDAHEAYMGDIVTPIRHVVGVAAGAFLSILPPARQHVPEDVAIDLGFAAVRGGLKTLALRLDQAIYTAAGITYPLSEAVQKAVHDMDLRMLKTERQHLLGPTPKPWPEAVEQAKPIALRGRFPLWPWPQAADEYRDRLKRYIPSFNPRATQPIRRAA